MHTFGEAGAGVPAFLAKLWRLVEDPETNNLICWSKDGRSFIIQNQAQFARELLPLNYKHNNMASFIRQLNMYGFHKITSIDNGGLKFDRDEMEFTHPCFKRDCSYLLEHIKRKIASAKSVDEKSAMKPEAVTKVLQDVKAMRGRQDSLDSRFSVMKQENEALWREIASLRQKHAKQQQIVNKLIQFLITIVQPQRNMSSVKRHMQLMINDIPDNAKLRKTSESESECGPVIHELGEELLDEVADVEPELMVPQSPFGQPSTPGADHEAAASPQNIERPQSSVSVNSHGYDYSNQSAEELKGYMSPNMNSGAGTQNDNLVQSTNSDGSKIFYHITEVPDAQPCETSPATVTYNDENVLTTPLVRQQMARNQLLKQRNRQKRSRNGGTMEPNAAEVIPKTKQRRVVSPQPLSPSQNMPQPIRIKTEQDIMDPTMYLNAYPDKCNLTPDPNLISPTINEDSGQSSTNNVVGSFLLNNSSSQGASNAAPSTGVDPLGNSSDLYNPNNFIANDMPADIFEDNSIMSAGDNSNFIGDDDFKLFQQQQFGRSTVNSGKFSSYIPANGSNGASNGSGPSTSAAAAAAAGRKQEINSSPASTSISKANDSNMALTKYNNKGQHEDVMRNEVSGHLDFVQDELDTLKDLLRSDVYSLDHNTLLGLFNDSDILGPYGLHLPADDNNAKKGSELMTYQPMYDLSDMINDQTNLDGDNNEMVNNEALRSPNAIQPPPSVLNTPSHHL